MDYIVLKQAFGVIRELTDAIRSHDLVHDADHCHDNDLKIDADGEYPIDADHWHTVMMDCVVVTEHNLTSYSLDHLRDVLTIMLIRLPPHVCCRKADEVWGLYHVQLVGVINTAIRYLDTKIRENARKA